MYLLAAAVVEATLLVQVAKSSMWGFFVASFACCVYYMWYTTRDEAWRQKGWDMWQGVQRSGRVEHGCEPALGQFGRFHRDDCGQHGAVSM